MTNKQQFDSTQVQSPAPQAPVAMRELTVQELVEIVGGPIIRNGDAINAVPPVATGG